MQILIDGSDSNTARSRWAMRKRWWRNHSQRAAVDAQNRTGGNSARRPSIARLRVWYNSSLESKNYVVPGLIAVILQIIAALLTSLTIAREWEMGTMEQLLSTPLRPAEMVLGKMLAYFVVGVVDAVIALLVGGLRVSGAAARQFLLLVAIESACFCSARCSGASLFRRVAKNAVAGVSDGHAELVPAGVSALGIRVCDREHAAGDSGDHAYHFRRATSSRF